MANNTGSSKRDAHVLFAHVLCSMYPFTYGHDDIARTWFNSTQLKWPVQWPRRYGNRTERLSWVGRA